MNRAPFAGAVLLGTLYVLAIVGPLCAVIAEATGQPFGPLADAAFYCMEIALPLDIVLVLVAIVGRILE